MIDEFIKNHPGVIDDDDDMAEVLYKMNEHLYHIMLPLTDFIANEKNM